MISTSARSAIAAAVAKLQRHPGTDSDMNVAGAVVVVVDPDQNLDAAVAVEAIGQTLGYKVASWSDGPATSLPATREERWGSIMTLAAHDGQPAMLVSRARATPFKRVDHYRSVQEALAKDGGHCVVIVADRRDDEIDTLIEMICHAVTKASHDGSNRDGGVEVIEL